MRDEGRRLWEIYSRVVGPRRITRVAVRYINQIDIPLRAIDYKDYFRTTPEVSPVLPQGISGFFMQLQFPQADFGGVLILTQTAIPPPSEDMNSVILDLDVFKESTELASDSEVWGLIETLRNRKNEFFEGCLTDKARELFGQRKEY
ncbi:MAG: TIGR04255 family protein [Bryobacteraceae bacterium]